MMNTLLSYFYDAQAKFPLPQDSHGNFKVEMLGKDQKPPTAGVDSVYAVIYARNDHEYPMELQPVTMDRDLKITEWPEFLEPGDIGKVTLAFSPSADRIKPLEGGSWDFTKIVMASSSSSSSSR